MEPIATLHDLKQVFITAYAKIIGETPMRSDIIYELSKLTQVSLLRYKSAYADFEKLLGSNKDMYAHWITIQLLVTTLLDGNDDLLNRGYDAVITTLKGTPAGGQSDMMATAPNNRPSRSYIMALLFRVYLDDIDLPPETKEVKPAPRSNAR